MFQKCIKPRWVVHCCTEHWSYRRSNPVGSSHPWKGRRKVAAQWCDLRDPVDCSGVCPYASPSPWYRLYLRQRIRCAAPTWPFPKDPPQSDTGRLYSWRHLVRKGTRFVAPGCCPCVSWKFSSRVAARDPLRAFPPRFRLLVPCPRTRSLEQTAPGTRRCLCACETPVSARGKWKFEGWNTLELRLINMKKSKDFKDVYTVFLHPILNAQILKSNTH